MKLPHEDDWELSFRHAHSRAKALLSEDFFWSCIDDNSPWGNDAGADALYFYSSAHSHPGSSPDPIGFTIGYLETAGKSLESWPLPRGHSRMDARLASSAHDSVIGIAFGMYLIHGWIDPELRDLARAMIEREKSPDCLEFWGFREERLQRLNLFSKKLNQMETEASS